MEQVVEATISAKPRPRQHHVIGLVGGLSWQSTVLYYRLINQCMAQALGGHNNAESITVTVNFEHVYSAGLANDWDGVTRILAEAARTLEYAGAGCLLLTANTAHRVADQVAEAVSIPLIHIAEVTAEAVGGAGLGRVGLVGTKQMLEGGIFEVPLQNRGGVEVVLPDAGDRDCVQRIILDELTVGTVNDASRDCCRRMVDNLVDDGAEGIVIGCTELPLLFDGMNCPVLVFDTTRLHAEAAVEFALTA